MDPKSEQMLKIILAKDVNVLGEDEKAFLIGRRGYLNEVDYKRYEDIFAPVDGKKSKTSKKEVEVEEEEEIEEVDEQVAEEALKTTGPKKTGGKK